MPPPSSLPSLSWGKSDFTQRHSNQIRRISISCAYFLPLLQGFFLPPPRSPVLNNNLWKERETDSAVRQYFPSIRSREECNKKTLYLGRSRQRYAIGGESLSLSILSGVCRLKFLSRGVSGTKGSVHPLQRHDSFAAAAAAAAASSSSRLRRCAQGGKRHERERERGNKSHLGASL